VLARFSIRTFRLGGVAAALLLAAAPAAADWRAKVETAVLAEALTTGGAEFLVILEERADLGEAAALASKEAKGAYVFDRLREVAARTQGPLLAALTARGVAHQPYWVTNMVWAYGDTLVLQAAAERAEVARVVANPWVAMPRPVDEPLAPGALAGVEPNVAVVGAPEVWALGYTGQGVVVGGADTGVEWDHPALRDHYRGWDGASADHAYSWHDAIHSGGGSCGADSPEPCDDHGHGTHTMGTLVGDDGGANQIGMAPGARWIACRNMDQGVGSPATYSECFQWFIAPTDASGENPDPSKAPHVINNSWHCPPSEGCTTPEVLETVVENTRAAGIVVVVSATNEGPGCETVQNPPAIYEASFTVGATTNTDAIASFSSRGPVSVDGSNRLKPDVTAPGVGVRSSIRNALYSTKSGTSMSGPHVAGLISLMISSNPLLAGHVDALESLVTATAVPLTTSQGCGGDASDAVPNNTFGHGRIDALAAVEAAEAPAVPGLSLLGALLAAMLIAGLAGGSWPLSSARNPQRSPFLDPAAPRGHAPRSANPRGHQKRWKRGG
jgi:subtilisin family serine protease